MKLKKTRKVKTMRGKGMGTHGWGARKKHMGSGHRGGFGMAGTGKKADHKKSLVIKKYGNKYFGKQGITSKGTERKKRKGMNLDYIEQNIERLKNKQGIVDISKYKVLGRGVLKSKVTIKAGGASEKAIELIEKSGSKIILPKKAEEVKEKAKEPVQEKKEEIK